MAENFHGSKRKIQRAAKHLFDLNQWLTRADFYILSINQDAERRNCLTLFFDTETSSAEDAAVMIGDVLHNLRSALDILWNDIIVECGGTVTKWSGFPIRNTVDELKALLSNLVEKKQIEAIVQSLLLNDIKPYEAGNHPLWALHNLNIVDKHRLIIPVIKIMHIIGVSFEDENGKEWPLDTLLMADRPWTLPLKNFHGKTLTIKNKGQPASSIVFHHGVPFAGEQIVPSLDGIAKEVSRTVKAFETRLFGES